MKKILFIGTICLFCSITIFSQTKKTWEEIQSVNSIKVYKQFIHNYPDGKYTEMAKQKLARLEEDLVLERKEQQNKLIRPDNFKKLQAGMTPKEVVSLLLFEDYINETRFGRIFIGIGLLPNEGDSVNSYTGTAILSGYYISFENGKSKEWKIINNEVGNDYFHGEYTFSSFGLMTLTSNWSLKGKTFNVKVRKPDGMVTIENTYTE